MKSQKGKLRICLGVSVIGLLSTAAHGQELAQTDPSPAIADIVVTANRREQAQQKVPTAITAYDANRLREQSVATAADLVGKVPSVQVSSNASQRSTEIIVIRGQGQTYLSPIGVVQYFGEVPLIQGGIVAVQGGPGTFFDLESLQVLRGPQGTLFGRNTTGGAVLLGPKKPGKEFGGYVQAQFGNYNDREFEGAIDLPVVSDRLLVRIAGKKVDRDGFTKDVGPAAYGLSDICISNPAGCFGPRSPGFAGKDYDDRHYWHARIGVTFRPVDGVENYLVGYYAKSHDNGTGFVFDNISTVTPLNVTNIAANLAYQRPLGNIFDPAIAAQVLAAQKRLGVRKTAMNTDQFTRLKSWGLIDTLSVDLTDSLTFRNIVSYQRLTQDYNWDLDGSLLPILSQQAPTVPAGSPWAPAGSKAHITNLSQITEEAQIQGKFLDGKLNTVVGFYYSYVKPESVQGTGSFNSADYNPGSFYDIRTRSLAGYAQASLDLGAVTPGLDRLTVTGGIRVTNDRIKGSRYATNFLLLPGGAATLDTTEPTWTIGLDYQATSRVLLYGKVTRGYKAGSFNYAAPSQESLTSKPEFVTNYEIGAKTDFQVGGVPVRVNVNGYHLDYKGLQRAQAFSVANGNLVNGVCIGFDGQPNGSSSCVDQGAIVVNAQAARINGIEVETAIRPARGLEIAANYSYMDAKYKRYALPLAPDPLARVVQGCGGPVAVPFPGQPTASVDLSCAPFQLAPKHLFNLNGRYSSALPNSAGTLVLAASYSYVGRTYNSSSTLPSDDPNVWVKAYGLVNASVELNGIGGSGLDARLFVTNLTDKVYRVNAYSGLNTATGFTNSTYGEPRMYGVSLRYRFGG
ncbi:hypothetical protein L288_12835 [Sphingobium quisquiliarum P25]|uniref:TonB-dependent receptor plug domain-containing protein n=1 Tax=Sphingobium quisquiliarum P25 TaxID=1329909 RepID=T0I1I2_9SPHN|nr:TonB-dependent receptor plug domain-containing protein [Sphingobium quisquiliarum]EQB05525.1 hypothetical protein L288_12835 [Sphingobium quisquiliarum P25]